jgi:5-formyltetrahydrofolate cyclo-ligase
VIRNESEKVEPDVVLVPGVAFDEALNRIGYGVGYFDRFLKETDALKVGICFDMQIVPCITTQPHDVRMDMVVTEKRVIKPG